MARTKQKQPLAIYRSRQATRSDIEELLAPNFAPQVPSPTPVEETSAPAVIDYPPQSAESLTKISDDATIPPRGIPLKEIPLEHVPPEPEQSEELDWEEARASIAAAAADFRKKRTGKVILVSRVEDGHSVTQNNVYWFLWRSGVAVKGSRSRFVQIGYGQIQAGVRIHRSAIQDAIQDLKAKLCIRVREVATDTTGTMYEVYSCEDILGAWKKAGLLWARRYGSRRVNLLTSPELDSLSGIPLNGTPSSGIPSTLSPLKRPVPLNTTGSVSLEGTPPIPLGGTQLVNKQIEQTTTTAELTYAMRAQGVELDPAAVDRISRECQAIVSNVESSEIVALFAPHYFALHRRGSARNPVGVMLADFSTWFSADRLEALRRQKQATMEEPLQPELEVDPHEAIRRMFSGEG